MLKNTSETKNQMYQNQQKIWKIALKSGRITPTIGRNGSYYSQDVSNSWTETP